MELQNKAQGKKFSAGSAVLRNRGSVRTFLLQPNRMEKSFADTPALTATKYRSRSASSERKGFSTQDRSANVPGPVESFAVRDIHSAYAPQKTGGGRMFVDQHSYREQGKSQKSLDRRNPPMTIDQVRELLNKNK